MNILQTNPQDSRTKRKLVSKIKDQYPNIGEKELGSTLNGIRKFVNLVRKIRTEPQAEILIAEKKIGSKTIKTRVTKLNYEELIKVKGKDEPKISIKEAMSRLATHYPAKKYARRKSKKK